MSSKPAEPDEYKPAPTVTDEQRKKTLAFITGGDDNSDDDEGFIPSKLPKVEAPAQKKVMPKLDDSDDDYKPSTKRLPPTGATNKPKPKSGLGLPPPPGNKQLPITKPSIRKTVAFAGSDDDEGEGFANITMKTGPPPPLPKGSGIKKGAAF